MKNNTVKYKRIVIKVGSSTLTHKNGKLNFTRIDHLLRQITDIKNQGREVILVTSGAIGAGMGELSLNHRPETIKEQQAVAAVGQGMLIGVYNKLLREYGEKGAQVLLTASDMENRQRYLNAFNTLTTLLEYKVIPIINENDTVATEEIEFGDNDTLSARVAGLVEADLLINLTDIEGLYNKNPELENKNLKVIHKVEKIDSRLEKIAGDKGSKLGTGGMYTKIKAARIAVESGIAMIIGPGYEKNIIIKLVNMLETKKYYKGTTFLPEENSLSKRKQWLCFNLSEKGRVVVDKGAEIALVKRGKSLLPGGILEVEGDFSRGDLVSIINQEGKEIGKGIVNYSKKSVAEIKGHQSQDIMDILGYVNQEEVVHRDNLVIKRGKKDEY
ncbi:MAG: glutamate 5-kinase [Bacillota bacterium]